MTVEAVLRDVDRDRVFYDASRGGITCSGGEPLSQPGFLKALLDSARSRGLTTCVDTCGAGSRRVLLSIAPLTDLLAETEKMHGAYEPTAPKHHWSTWYAAYVIARERGRTPEEAAQDAARHVQEVAAQGSSKQAAT